MILASELSSLGLSAGSSLSSLGFDVTASGSGTQPQLNYSIKIAHTSATVLSAYLNPSFTVVHTSSSVPAPPIGVRTFPFTTNFDWDGVSNILIDICHDNSAAFSGNSTVKVTPMPSKNYLTYDRNPALSTYYRLKTIDNDGMETYSKFVVVDRLSGKFNLTSTFPNPTNGDVSVRSEAVENNYITITMIDLLGKVVLSQRFDGKIGLNEVTLEMQSLPNATYFIKVSNGKDNVLSKIVKQ